MDMQRVLCCAAAGLLACTLPSWANRYRILDLGTEVRAAKINDLGTVVGYGIGLGMLYRHGAWHALPAGDGGAQAMAVNDLGQATGWDFVQQDGHWVVRAILWQRDQAEVVLPMPIPAWQGYPQAISNTGLVVGYYNDNYDPWRCFLWSAKGGSIDLGGDEHPCVAYDVNEFGQVVGEANFVPGGQVHAFLWSAGKMRDLGALGGPKSTALGINALGHVVGLAIVDGEPHAFVWRHGKMTDLSQPADFHDTFAVSINVKGDIVGNGFSVSRNANVAVRFEEGRIVPLADEVENLDNWDLEWALDVNERGAIVGEGFRTNDIWPHFFVLVPGASLGDR